MGMLSGTTRGGRRAWVIGSLIVQLAFALACAAPGERASAADPRMPDAAAPCPARETCSSLAPRGLHFSGTASPLGGAPAITAVGGVQTISFALSQHAELAAAVESGAAAATLEPGVADGTGWRWSFKFGPSAAGVATVAIRESATRALLDRIALDAAAPERVTIERGTVFNHEPLGLLWLGSTVRFFVDARTGPPPGELVIDEQWTVRAQTPSALAVEGNALRGQLVGQWALRVQVGSTALSNVVRVVEAVDAIRVVNTLDDVARPSPWTFDEGVLHVQATLGGVTVDGAPITVESAMPTLVNVAGEGYEWLGDGVFLVSLARVAAPTRVPITFRSGAVVLRGEVLLTP